MPRWCGASTEFWEKAKQELNLNDEELCVRFGDDFRRITASYEVSQDGLAAGVTYKTIFGIERSGLGYGQPLSHPLADADIQAVHAHPWPDASWVNVSKLRADAAPWKGQGQGLGQGQCQVQGRGSIMMLMFMIKPNMPKHSVARNTFAVDPDSPVDVDF